MRLDIASRRFGSPASGEVTAVGPQGRIRGQTFKQAASVKESKRAGERTRTVDIQLGKLTFYH